MLYVSEYCIAAVMGTAVLFATYFLKRNYDTLHNRLFLCMILINLFWHPELAEVLIRMQKN